MAKAHAKNQKKVLCIVTAVPPEVGMGTIRVERVLWWLAQYGWEPVVLAIADPSPPDPYPWWRNGAARIERVQPFRLERLLHRQPPWTPFTSGGGRASHSPNHSTIAGWLRRTLSDIAYDWVYVPDRKVFGIRPAITLGRKLVTEERPCALWSSSPSLSAQVVARALSEQYELPWLAEIRDILYTDPVVHGRRLSWWRQKRSIRIETSVARSADGIVLVSHGARDMFIERHYRDGIGGRCHVISHGFEPEHLRQNSDCDPMMNKSSGPVTLLHTGVMYQHRDLTGLWRALSLLKMEGKISTSDLRIQLVGDDLGQGVASAADLGVDEYVESTPRLPVQQALRMQSEADILLLVTSGTDSDWARAWFTGKLGDYLGAQRPILALVHPDGDAARAVRQTKTGIVFHPHDVEGIKHAMAEFLDCKMRLADIPYSPDFDVLSRFSWQNLGREYAELLSSVVENHRKFDSGSEFTSNSKLGGSN